MPVDTWEISEDFQTDPTARGWAKIGTDLDWDNTEEAIGGNFNGSSAARYYKALTANKSLTDIFEAIFNLRIASYDSSGEAYAGLMSAGTWNEDAIFVALLENEAYLYLCYASGQGTQISVSSVSLTVGTIYQCVIRNDPILNAVYLEIFDDEGNAVGNVGIAVPAGKTITVGQVGIVNNDGTAVDMVAWCEEVRAIPSSLTAETLYCTPAEVTDLIAILDNTVDFTESQARSIIFNLTHAKLNAWFKAIGFDVPFDTGTSTPPMIRSLAIRLSTYYALFKLYTGHSPNEVGTMSSLKKEIKDDLKDLKDGDMELLDVDGDIIEAIIANGLQSTTEGEEDVFTLEDVPDIYGEDASAEWQ